MEPNSAKDIIDIAKNSFEILVLIIAGILAFRINWRFVPIIYLDISSEWLDQANGKLKLKLTVENKASVKAVKRKIQLQILRYNLSETNLLSEWVPFNENAIRANEKPISWSEPVEVWDVTQVIYPGEITSLDYMCDCPKGQLLHVGLLFEGHPDYSKKIFGLNESWCTTKIFANTARHL